MRVVGAERGRNGNVGRRRQAGAMAAIFFIWVILVVSRMRLSSAAAKEEPVSRMGLLKSVHRKTHMIFETDVFKAPASLHNAAAAAADIVYEDEKRVVHTGPNPLHN